MGEVEEEIGTDEVAKLKRVSRRAVYAAIHTGKLPARRVVGRWVVKRADLDQWQPVGGPGRPPRPRRQR